MEGNINNPSDGMPLYHTEETEIQDEVLASPDELSQEPPTEQSEDELEEQKITFKDKVKSVLARYEYGQVIARLLVAWVLGALVELIFSDYVFNTFDYFNHIKVWRYVLIIVLTFILLNLLNKPKLDKILLFFVSLVYSSMAIADSSQFYFSVGLCIFMGAISVYCTGDWIKIRLKKIPTVIIISLFGIIFTLFVGLLTSFLYLRHWSSCYDFGIFSQMFYYMKETFLPLTTCERDGLLSHFAIHFSPIYYLILPFFYIFPTPVTLLMAQAAIIASGLIPLYLLCKKYNFSNNVTIIFSLLYILLPSMANGCFYLLHENKFLTALLLWLFYALEKNKWILSIVFAFLVMFVKEDAPVYVAIIGLYFLVSKRNIKKGSVLLLLGIAYFITVSYFMTKYGAGTMNYRYNNFMYDGGDSLITVIKAVILNPIYTIQECFDENKIKFFLQMLVPVAFMPFMAKKPSRVILFIPLILINLMSDYQYQYDIGFQYTYGSAGFLFYIMIMNYSEMKHEFRSKLLVTAAACSVLMFMSNTYHRTDGFKSYANDVKNNSIEVIDEALDLIPRDAPIAATTFLIPSLYDCREIYEYETTKHLDKVEYIALDGRYSSDDYSIDDYLNNPKYETIVNIPSKIAIFRNTEIAAD